MEKGRRGHLPKQPAPQNKEFAERELLRLAITQFNNTHDFGFDAASLKDINKTILNGLVDASKLGTKVKDGKNQKTLLSREEENRIIQTFNAKEPEMENR